MKIVSPEGNKLVRAVVKNFVDFVGTTYGPAGKKVLIQDNFSIKAADDGKTVAEAYELKDETENAIVGFIKEALTKTEARVGDGTTTAAIITGAIVEQVLGANELLQRNPHIEIPKLKKALIEAVKQIEKLAKPVKTKEELYKVAYNSFNNEEIAGLISETLFKIGKDGIISVEDSLTAKTECEIAKGTEIAKGYVSPYFINEDDKVSLKNPYIILVNKRLDSVKDVASLLQKIAQSGHKDVMFIAEGYGDELIGFLVVGKVQGIIRPLLVENPMFGEHRLDFLQDIAAVCGGTIVDDKTSIELKNLNLESLGRAVSVVSKKNSTIITGGKGNKTEISAHVNILKTRQESSTNLFEKDKLAKRIATLSGGVAVLKIGADTENEQKAKKLKVDDAVSAAKIAFQNGIVEGGGKTFEKLKTSSDVLNEALKAPRKKLIENGEELLDDKVVDPASVLIAALESAVSIGSELVTMSGVIATKRKKEDGGDLY